MNASPADQRAEPPAHPPGAVDRQLRRGRAREQVAGRDRVLELVRADPAARARRTARAAARCGRADRRTRCSRCGPTPARSPTTASLPSLPRTTSSASVCELPPSPRSPTSTASSFAGAGATSCHILRAGARQGDPLSRPYGSSLPECFSTSDLDQLGDDQERALRSELVAACDSRRPRRASRRAARLRQARDLSALERGIGKLHHPRSSP